MPPLNALLTSLLDLACAERRKVILPLVDHPSEMVLERDGDTLYVSHYTLDNPPELYHWDQAIHYRELLDFSIEALQQSIDTSSTPQQDKALIDRAFNTVIAPDIEGRPHAVVFRANTQANSKVRVQGLEFGFTASVRPSVDKRAQDIDFSDLHALLFQGSMWVWFQGKRIPLIKGPIALAVQHMLRLADRIVDHWMHGRPGNYSFCTHNLRMGMRLNPQGHVELKFSDAQHTHLRIPSMQIRDVVLPLVRLAAAMTRSLVRVDQQQRRNLYVRELRDLMRSLRRRVMTDPAQEGFTNQNPNRLQALRHAQDKPDSTSALNASTSTLPALQFEARWSAEIDGLDIGSTFYCGDRFIIRHADMLSALSSDTGQTLWSRPCGPITVIGQTLLDLSHPEHIELCDIKQGESFARIDARAPTNCQQTLLSVNSPHIPPTCLLLTQDHHCIAFDLRHGQMRWRLRHYHHAQLHAACSGRVVVMAADHHTLIALDALQGDILWRFSARAQFTSTPVIFDDTVVVFSGDIGHANCRAIGIDLLSGAARWECELKAPRTSAAFAMNDCVLVGIGEPGEESLTALDPHQGKRLWTLPDPGIASGGSWFTVDHKLLINSLQGELSCIDASTGELTWSQMLTDSPCVDMPRHLRPVLRHGALFVPSNTLHMIRLNDGQALAHLDQCKLIPDLLRVDDRSWIYVAEESGHISAFAPKPQLRLIKGGQ